MKTVAVKGHKGIRQKPNGKFIVTRSIKGERFTKEFEKKIDAIHWKANFHPLVDPNPKPVPLFTQSVATLEPPNGRDTKITFSEVFATYKEDEFTGLEIQTQHKKLLRANHFLTPLYSIPMYQMNPRVINNHIKDMKKKISQDSKRCNFDKELKDLNRIFVWYNENPDSGDFTFHNPVKKFHFKFGKVKDIEPVDKSLSVDELLRFFDSFETSNDGFMFQTLAITEFYMAGRPQEAAAVSTRTVDFKARKIAITEKIVWFKGKPIPTIGTKTGEDAIIDMPEEVFDRLQILKTRMPKGCRFFFHRNGNPLRHQLILSRFNEALERAGLSEKYSGINILRHSMATLSRKIGGLNASQAILRHTTARMSEVYAQLDVNENVTKVVIQAEEIFREKRLRARATKCNQVSEAVM